jgi:hypothetical protein
VNTMRKYYRSQEGNSEIHELGIRVKEYNMFVHGWIFYMLPPIVNSSSENSTSVTTNNVRLPQDHRITLSNQFVPDSMTACWSGWYVSRPIETVTINAIKKYLVGPLYYLTPIFHAEKTDLGRLCTPYCFREHDVDNLNGRTIHLKQNLNRCIAFSKECGGGDFYTNGTLEIGLKKYVKLAGDTYDNKGWMFMIVELRHNKMLKAWIEASRGVVR